MPSDDFFVDVVVVQQIQCPLVKFWQKITLTPHLFIYYVFFFHNNLLEIRSTAVMKFVSRK